MQKVLNHYTHPLLDIHTRLGENWLCSVLITKSACTVSLTFLWLTNLTYMYVPNSGLHSTHKVTRRATNWKMEIWKYTLHISTEYHWRNLEISCFWYTLFIFCWLLRQKLIQRENVNHRWKNGDGIHKITMRVMFVNEVKYYKNNLSSIQIISERLINFALWKSQC